MLKHGVKLIVLLAWWLSWTPVLCQKINQQDSLALVALYSNTNGPLWTDHTDWLVTEPTVSPWFGVTLALAGGEYFVTELRLPGNNLAGPLPDELFNMNSLNFLDLSQNSITSANAITSSFEGNLGTFQEVDLSHNQIGGSLGGGVGGWENASIIDLSFNQFSGPLPAEFYDLNPTELYLNDNSFTGEIAKAVSNLGNLQILHVQNNHFDGRIPGELDDLSLTDLNLSGNRFIRMDELTNFIGGSVTVNVQNNRLQFDDVVPYVGSGNFSFIPQDSVNSNKLYSLVDDGAGESVYIQLRVRGTNNGDFNATDNNYDWHKIDLVGVDLGGQDNDYDISLDNGPVDAGKYYCVVTNPNVPGLTLITRTATLKFLPCGAKINAQDSLALVAFYNSTGGPNWTNHANWLAPNQNVSTWFGVTLQCDRVVSVVLKNNNLTGSLPGNIGDLATLKELDLTTNHLSGGIPPSIGNLRNLDHLFLGENQLNGSIPPELGNLTHALGLYLDHNQLTGTIPNELGNLNDYLFELGLSNNQLTGTVDVVTNLAVVSYLYMSGNQFSGPLPEAITDLPRLLELYLDGNKLSGSLPIGLDRLIAMAVMGLSSNQFTGTIPSNITLMPSITHINLNDNQIAGNIPGGMSNLATLKILNLAHNQLTGTLQDIHDCTSLEDLNVEGNLLNDDFGSFLLNVGYTGNPGSFTSINIGFNQFYGNLEDILGLMTNLEFFSAAENNLSGPLPANIGNLNKLGLIDVSRNQLDGNLPPGMGTMSDLVVAELWDNQFSGAIPVELGNLSKLKTLHLHNNQLSGSIPKELADLPELLDLGLGTNLLTGGIPPELGNLSKLTILSIDNNQLTGALPKELANVTTLTHVDFGVNSLSGTLPKEYASLTNLQFISFGSNSFTGAVPPEYLAWTNATDLYFQENHLTSVPAFTNTFNVLRIDDNDLTFESIEPFFTNLPTTFVYAPQDDTGLAQILTRQAGCPYSIPTFVGGSANLYQWFKDGSPISGIASATISLAALVAGDAGVYTCEVTNSIVTGLTIHVEPVTLGVSPAVNATLAEAALLCNASTLTATPSNLFSYQWYVDGKKIVGATSNSYEAYYDGSYSVVYQPDAASCNLTTPALAVTGLYADATPIITSSGSPITKLATANSASSYQWYVNDKVIANGTSADLNVWYNGSYYLVVALTNGCRYKSNTIVVSEGKYASLARQMMEGDTVKLNAPGEMISVVPNPAKDIVTINTGPFPAKRFEFHSDLGNTVFRKDFDQPISSLELDVSSWSAGVYIVTIASDENKIWRKFVKY